MITNDGATNVLEMSNLPKKDLEQNLNGSKLLDPTPASTKEQQARKNSAILNSKQKPEGNSPTNSAGKPGMGKIKNSK